MNDLISKQDVIDFCSKLMIKELERIAPMGAVGSNLTEGLREVIEYSKNLPSVESKKE